MSIISTRHRRTGREIRPTTSVNYHLKHAAAMHLADLRRNIPVMLANDTYDRAVKKAKEGAM